MEELNKFSSLIARLKNKLFSVEENKNKVLEAVKETSGLNLDFSEVRVQGLKIFLKIDPYRRSEIVLNKEEIEKKITIKTGKRFIIV